VKLRPELRRFGNCQAPVVVIDDFSGDAESLIAVADALAPYDNAGNYYPGLRRIITEADQAANDYVERTCEAAAQFVAGAFDVDGFDLVEASFSMVTRDPAELNPTQRAPHFDSTEPKYFALLHYLRVPEGTGTAFYRQRSTRIERVTKATLSTFVRAAEAESAMLPSDSGYIAGSNDFFEQIGAVEAVPDRLIIYQGCLLHSGIIPAGMNFSPDPRIGRLTANFFLRGH
jgi:Family of unknown function (DUF6445)